MRRLSVAMALLLSGCSGEWSRLAPFAPEAPARVSAERPRLYGRPLELVRAERQLPTARGAEMATAHLLREAAIPGVPQVEVNDCGPAAVATLLGYYGLQPVPGGDPLVAVKQRMPPKQWGTSLEEVTAYLNRTGHLWAKAYRDGSLEALMAIVQDGRPVPVVVTLEGSLTRMHWLLVVGLARTTSGERFVLCKNPSDSDRLALSAFEERAFLQQWENSPLRSQWWSSLMDGVTDSNVASYRRPYLDVGALAPP